MTVSGCIIEINMLLARIDTQIKLNSSANLMDLNILLEGIFRRILNILQGWDLADQNIDRPNTPGIDLADPARRICVQITSEATPQKVRETLRVFFDNHQDRDYDKLYIVFLKNKKLSAKSLKSLSNDVKPGFDFNPAKHIWDFGSLIQRMKSAELEKLVGIKSILNEIVEGQSSDPSNHFSESSFSPPCSVSGEFITNSRKTDVEAIKTKLLESNRPLFICGPSGIGKTDLILDMVANNSLDKPIRYIEFFQDSRFEESAMQTSLLHAILSEDDFKNTDPIYRDKQIRECMEDLHKHLDGSILILDNFYLPGRTLGEALTELMQDNIYKRISRWSVQIIITTRYFVEKDNCYHIDPLDDVTLMNNIRKRCHNNNKFTNERLQPLLELVGSNTMMIELIIQVLHDRRITPEHLIRILKNGESANANLPECCFEHRKCSKPFHKHMYHLFDIQELDPALCEILQLALPLPEKDFPDDLFSQFMSDQQMKLLDRLSESHWIIRKNNEIKLYPVVRLVCVNRLSSDPTAIRVLLKNMHAKYINEQTTPEQRKHILAFFDNALEYLDQEDPLRQWYKDTIRDLLQNMRCKYKEKEITPVQRKHILAFFNTALEVLEHKETLQGKDYHAIAEGGL